MIKVIKFMEKMWMMASILTFLIAIYFSIQDGVFNALYFYGFSVVAGLLFMMRRRQRRFYEKQESEKPK